MIIEIKIPSPGESITEAAIGNWLIEDGSFVEKDQEIAEVETDKATLPLIAPESGKVKFLLQAGQKAHIGDVACTVDTDAKPTNQKAKPVKKQAEPVKEEIKIKPAETAVLDIPLEIRTSAPKTKVPYPEVKVTPLARNLMEEKNLDVDDIIHGLKKITRDDVEKVISHNGNSEQSKAKESTVIPQLKVFSGSRETKRIPLSPLRRKLGQRLVTVKNETAMLTTFNEVDMSAILDLRKKYQTQFQKKHGLKLGLMSFFTKACTEALKEFPRVNSMIEGDDLVEPQYIDIAIAVQTDKGLMVPVIRNTESMHLSDIEKTIAYLAQKAKAAKLTIDEMTGGTFTITNGGVFGSMLSTPIINPPQSAILGMHNIAERPVVVDGKIVIRPIMYVALSYDHRVVDGRDSVSFLVKVKEFIESPTKMALHGEEPEEILLSL